ncbi:hypothetical protein SETIT_9G277600v2 [Setaria italica]|uniref:Uncharacterized protein n=1 Tax=Setaria italica TaxID=4555 RepID=A0A368SLI8_SETIT|nr:hypothetical protein SETIT_9G277600v2 [Setaria italica]
MTVNMLKDKGGWHFLHAYLVKNNVVPLVLGEYLVAGEESTKCEVATYSSHGLKGPQTTTSSSNHWITHTTAIGSHQAVTRRKAVARRAHRGSAELAESPLAPLISSSCVAMVDGAPTSVMGYSPKIP